MKGPSQVADSSVVFRAAAGPRIGFGHLVRCRSLARAYGCEPVVSVRGTAQACTAAASLGMRVITTAQARARLKQRNTVLVIDDPSARHARAWVAAARRALRPVATVHDLGLARVEADLVIDGSIAGGSGPTSGPSFSILDPAVSLARLSRRPLARRRVLVTLGGGAHVHAVAADLCRAVAARQPNVDLRIARGFTERPPALLPHGRWVRTGHGLARELAGATAAIVAGGVTLYEACAIGVPSVAVAVTSAQHRTIRAFTRYGAVIDGGLLSPDSVALERVADRVAGLLEDAETCARLAANGRRLVDGQGAFRVAARLRALAVRAPLHLVKRPVGEARRAA